MNTFLSPQAMWTTYGAEGRAPKMPRLTVSDANGNSEQPSDVLTNGQFSLHPVPHPVGYPLTAGHFPHPGPGAGHSGGDVKQEYHVTGGSGEPNTAAAAAFTPSLGQWLLLLLVSSLLMLSSLLFALCEVGCWNFV